MALIIYIVIYIVAYNDDNFIFFSTQIWLCWIKSN